MKNTKLTKDMKHNIAYAMYNVYLSKKNIGWWTEFIPEIESCCPVITQVLHWNNIKIQHNITDSAWFRNYVLSGKYR